MRLLFHFRHVAHEHHHHHSHYHLHSNERSTRLVVLISVFTMIFEIMYGYRANSVALVTEGWHMLSHVWVLLMAWLVYWWMRSNLSVGKKIDDEKVLAGSALISSGFLLLMSGFIIKESLEKFSTHSMQVEFETLLVALIGLLVNGLSAFVLHREEEKMDINLRAAYVHVMSDVLLSLFAIASLAVAKWWNVFWLDPVLGVAGALLMMFWSGQLVVRSWRIIF